MEIRLEDLSKRFGRHWVFRDLNHIFNTGTHVAITGANGTGKSTLIKIILGTLPPSVGKVRYFESNRELTTDRIFNKVALAAPYSRLIEDLTLVEAWEFHRKFREWYEPANDFEKFHELLEYPFEPGMHLSNMSSGMKQRLRLAFAILTNSGLLLLDEPTTNLDSKGVEWFHRILNTYRGSRTVLVASNVASDIKGCEAVIDLPGRD